MNPIAKKTFEEEIGNHRHVVGPLKGHKEDEGT